MKKKVKYDNKRVFRKITISDAEYDSISNQAAAAVDLLKGKRFEFFRELLEAAKDYATKSILENTVKDVSEEISISETVKRTLFTPKKVQTDELSGQYKLIVKIFEDLNYFVDLKKSVDEKIADNRVVVSNEK